MCGGEEKLDLSGIVEERGSFCFSFMNFFGSFTLVTLYFFLLSNSPHKQTRSVAVRHHNVVSLFFGSKHFYRLGFYGLGGLGDMFIHGWGFWDLGIWDLGLVWEPGGKGIRSNILGKTMSACMGKWMRMTLRNNSY